METQVLDKTKDRISFREAATLQHRELGTPIETTEDFLHMIVPDEGELSLIYGKIGQGKTYCATEQILDDLRRGKVVYATWKINYEGFDERQSFMKILAGIFFPFHRIYKNFPKENLHYLDVYDEGIWDTLYDLNDCKIYFDDCIVQLFDSYEKTFFAKKKRQWAFETRHFDRSIILVTQRPNQVQVALRSQVNRFYKCSKRSFLFWPYFVREEFQDMVQETVDESKEPDSVKRYRPKQRIFEAYQSKYLRKGAQSSQRIYVDFYKLNYVQKVHALFQIIFSALKRRKNNLDVPFLDGGQPVTVEEKSAESAHKSLGVKRKRTTKKNSGGLNTTTVGEEPTKEQLNTLFDGTPF